MALARPSTRGHRLRAIAVWAGLATASSAATIGCAHARGPKPPIAVEVRIDRPTTQYFELRVHVARPQGKRSLLAIPAWAPGSYKIRDFARHVWDVHASTSDGTALVVTRKDKQTWEVDHGGRDFVVEWRTYADELSVRTAYVGDRFALVPGAAAYPYLVGERDRAYELAIKLPAGWSHRVALPGMTDDRYRATDYDELADAPLLAGAELVRTRFTVAQKPVDYVVAAPPGVSVDLPRLTADAERIVAAYAEVMGGLPFSEYAFLVIVDDVGGGGLEHKNSTAMILRPRSLESEAGYEGAARLAAHEFFHAWNVKRIRDRALFPFDYSRESYTELLWFHEGFTEAMEARVLLRCGLVSGLRFLDQLANAYNEYRRRPGSDRESLVTSSRDAWVKQYQPAASHRNETASYYDKGMLVGISLDLELRIASGGKGSLEGLFRRLWDLRGSSVGPRGKRRDRGDLVAKADEVPLTWAMIEDAASAEAGRDMRWFFDDHVRGTKPVDLPAQLERMGIRVTPASATAPVWFGAGGGREIAAIETASPAQTAGLMVGDRPVALDGREVADVPDLVARLERRAAGSVARVTLFRRGGLREVEVTLASRPVTDVRFSLAEDASLPPAVIPIRDAWLFRGTTAAAAPPPPG